MWEERRPPRLDGFTLFCRNILHVLLDNFRKRVPNTTLYCSLVTSFKSDDTLWNANAANAVNVLDQRGYLIKHFDTLIS